MRAVFRLILVALLGLAVPFQVGLMPARTGEGVVMVICSGDGPMLMVFDPATGTFHKAPAETAKTHCDWAASPVAMPAAPAEFDLPLRLWTGVDRATMAEIWRPAHDPRGLWARGPPLSV